MFRSGEHVNVLNRKSLYLFPTYREGSYSDIPELLTLIQSGNIQVKPEWMFPFEMKEMDLDKIISGDGAAYFECRMKRWMRNQQLPPSM